jgi:energy-coupling factor transport system substrate-specific component
MTWQLASFLLLGVALFAGFLWFERQRPPARVVGLVAVLAALAVAGRLAFAAVPNVKPTTDIVFFAGYALGAAPGFAVGAITAIASNVFLGQGPWTVWQMAAWGACGAGGALLAWTMRGRELGRVPLAIACGVAGLAFGAFMDVYQWTLAARQDLPTYVAISGSSFPYNLAHVVGNVAFCLLIGPVFIRSLRRYRRRFEVDWRPPGVPGGKRGAVVASALAVAVAAALMLPAGVSASPTSRAVEYLRSAQNRDGGFGNTPDQTSSQLVTGWSALGLASAGLNPRDLSTRRGRSVIAYLRRNTKQLVDVGELERTILVLRAAGVSPRRFAGLDLIRKLRRAQRADGSWEGNVAFTAFGLLALRAGGERAGSPRVGKAAGYLERSQSDDGGWGFVPGTTSDVDDTGAVLQALAAAGRRGAATNDGVAYLRANQASDGGWGQLPGRTSNAQSTSWAVQGLIAARARLGSLREDPLAYLRGLQRRDGHFAYSRTGDQTPVWVTAQALAAIRRKAFPLAPVKRAKRAAAWTAYAPADTGGGGSSAGDRAETALIAGGVVLLVGLGVAAGWHVRRGATA